MSYYLDALERFGGPRFALNEVWDEYRKRVLYGLAWALTAPQMQPESVILAMTRRLGDM